MFKYFRICSNSFPTLKCIFIPLQYILQNFLINLNGKHVKIPFSYKITAEELFENGLIDGKKFIESVPDLKW